MRRSLTTLVMLASGIATIGAGQETPYAGLERRPIKALSAEQVEGYLRGDGMSLALAAELNGYPGPKHVLELSAALELSEQQRESMERLYHMMNERAVSLGQDIVEAEARLDSAFAEGTVSPESLRQQLNHLGQLYGDLRYTHLEAHLETVTVLTDHQVALYQSLRGYGGLEGGHGDHSHGDP